MARQTEYIDGLFIPLTVGDGVRSDAIVGVIPADNLPAEQPPQPVQQYVLPDDLQHLEREVAFDPRTVTTSVWRLGSDAPSITLANTYRFLFNALAANTAVPNEISLGTGVTAAAPSGALRLDPARFVPTNANDRFTITQPNATSQFVLSCEFRFSPRLTTTRPFLQIKDNGSSTYHTIIGIGSSGIEYARVDPMTLTTLAGNRALAVAGWYRYIVHFRDIPNTNPATQTLLPNLLEISEVLYDIDNAGTGVPQLLQNQDILLGYAGATELDYTSIRLGGQQFEIHEVSGWQYDSDAVNPITRGNLVDWAEHHWDEPLGGRVRAPGTVDIARIRFLEELEAPRLFVGTAEVTADGLLNAVQRAKLQGDILTAISVSSSNLSINRIEANGNITTDTIALATLVPDDSIGTDELSDATVARLLPPGGTDGQILARNADGDGEWIDSPSGGSSNREELLNWEPTAAFPVEVPTGTSGVYGFKTLPVNASFRALTADDDNKLMVFELYGDDLDSTDLAQDPVYREISSRLVIFASEWRNASVIPETATTATAGKKMWFLPILYQRKDGWRRGYLGKGASGRPGGIWQATGTEIANVTPRITGLKVWLASAGGTSGGVGGQQDGQQVDSENNVRPGTLGVEEFADRDRAIIDPHFDLYAQSTLGVLEAAVGSRHTGPTIANDVRHSAAIVSSLLSASLPTIYDRSVNSPAPTTNTAFMKGMSFPEDPDRTGAIDRREGFAIRNLTPMDEDVQWVGAVTFKPANLDADRVIASFGRFGVNYQVDIILTSDGNIHVRGNNGVRVANAFIGNLGVSAGSWNVLSFLLTGQSSAGSINVVVSCNGQLANGTTIGSPDLASTQSLAFGNGLARQTLNDTFRGAMYDAWVVSATGQTHTILTGISSSPIGVRSETANTDSARDAPYGTAFGSLVGRAGMGEYVYQARLLPDLNAAQSFLIDATDGATVMFTPPINLDRTESVRFDFSPNGSAWYPVEVRADLIPRKTLADQFTVVTGTQARFVWQQDGLQSIILGEPYSSSFNQFQMSFVVDAGTASASRFNIWQNQPTAISIRPNTNIQIRNFRVRPSAI